MPSPAKWNKIHISITKEQIKSSDEVHSCQKWGHNNIGSTLQLSCVAADNQSLLLDWKVSSSHDNYVPTHGEALQVLPHALFCHWLQLAKSNTNTEKNVIYINIHVIQACVKGEGWGYKSSKVNCNYKIKRTKISSWYLTVHTQRKPVDWSQGSSPCNLSW